MFFHPRVRRGKATVHSMEMLFFMFRLVFPLFRILVYWTNKDLISV